MWERLADTILPQLAARCAARKFPLRCWSAGCASGEEPYSLGVLWRKELAARFSTVPIEILATDIDPLLLARAASAAYRHSSLRGIPPAWEDVFDTRGELRVLRSEFRKGIRFLQQDIRQEGPPGPFDLVLCRNLAFTYFDDGLQRRTLARMLEVLNPGGALVIGQKEHLPPGATGVSGWIPELGIYRKKGGGQPCS